jgi:hypothetical protein
MPHPVDMSIHNPSIVQAKRFDPSVAVQAVSRRAKNIGNPRLNILWTMLNERELCLHALQCLC